MSITAYTGLPGSGKSYGVVENVIIPAVKAGRVVYTNIPLNQEKWLENFGQCPEYFDIKVLEENPRWFFEVLPKGALVAIDEVWRLWPSGLKANQVKAEYKEFLAEHRHMVGEDGHSTEIILLTQDLAQIAAFARALVEYTFRSEKLTNVGLSKRYRIDVYQGAVSGPNPSKTQRLREIHGSYKQEVYELYKSHTKSETGTAGNESKVDERHNILKSAYFQFVIAFVFIGLFVVGLGIKKVQAYYTKADVVETKTLENKPEKQEPINQQEEPNKPQKPKIIDVLDGYDLEITYNNGQHIHDTEFKIKAEKYQNTFTVTTQQLLALGYYVKKINRCLLLVMFEDKMKMATCKKAEPGSLINFDWNVEQKAGI